MKFTGNLLLLFALPFTALATSKDVSGLTADLDLISNTFASLAVDARGLTLSLTGLATAQRILNSAVGLTGAYDKALADAQGLNPCPASEDDAQALSAAVTKLTNTFVDACSIDKSALLKGWGLAFVAANAITLTRDKVVAIFDAIVDCAPDSIKQAISDDKDLFVAKITLALQIYSP